MMWDKLALTVLLAGCFGGSGNPPAQGPIALGFTGPLSGPTQLVGLANQRGIQLAIDEKNTAGGIAGRQLVLHTMDDSDDPSIAEQDSRNLVAAQITDSAPNCPSTLLPLPDRSGGTSPVSTTALDRGTDSVLAMLDVSGGQNAIARSAVVTVETGTLFFGASSGYTTTLRDGSTGDCGRYLFNYRASYAQEALGTLRWFQIKNVTGSANLISFDEDDSYGDAGYAGMVGAYATVYGQAPGPIARFRYARNDDTSVPTQAVAVENYLAQLLGSQTGTVYVGIMMTDTYGAATTFIQAVRDWQFQNDAQQGTLHKATRLRLVFSNVSHVEPNALAERLVAAGNVPGTAVPYTQDVDISSVVPDYKTDTSPDVVAYRQLAADQTDFLSEEGFLVTRAFLGVLAAHHGALSPDALGPDLDALAPDHQISNSVWGFEIQPDGGFAPAYVCDPCVVQ